MITAILIAVIVVALLVNSIRKPKNFPPGPMMTVPYWGSFLAFGTNPQPKVDKFYESYGPYVGVVVGGFKVVVTSGWKAVTESFMNEDLLGRPDVCLIRDRFDGENYGVLFADGDDWRTQRRFTLHHFRNLGFGRKSHESVIWEEAEDLVQIIREKKGQPFCLETYLSTSLINVTWSLLGGKRYGHTEIQILAGHVKECIHNIKILGSVAVIFPFLRYLFPKQMGYTGIKRGTKGLLTFVQKIVKEHKQTIETNNPRDFVDIYLEELQKPDVDPSFSEKQLGGICVDMLCAGGDTTLSSINFAILFLCLKQDLQEKVYSEILEHVGLSRLPSTEDKANLVYTEAVFMEVLRTRTPVPISIPHRALRNTTLGGYHIPKDTILMMNINSVLMDKSYWQDPETFRPERFVTQEGKLRMDERLIPFGKGKRACIGQNLARSSGFILLASLIQNFSFSLDPDLPMPETDGVPGFTMAAPFFQVVATQRRH